MSQGLKAHVSRPSDRHRARELRPRRAGPERTSPGALCAQGRKLRIVCGDGYLGLPALRRRAVGRIRRAAPQSHRAHRCARPRRTGGGEHRPAGHRRGAGARSRTGFWSIATGRARRFKESEALMIVNKAIWEPPRSRRNWTNIGAWNWLHRSELLQSGEGIEQLAQLLAGRVNLLVGQSGVGKSSLVNALVPAGRGADRGADARCRRTAHDDDGALVSLDAGFRDHRCAGRARLCAARAPGACGRARLCRDSRAQRAMPFQRLPAHGRTGLRGAHRRNHRQISARRYESYRRLFRLYEKLAS